MIRVKKVWIIKMEKKATEKRKEIYYTGSKVLQVVGENRGPKESKERVYLLSAASDALMACLLAACFAKWL